MMNTVLLITSVIPRNLFILAVVIPFGIVFVPRIAWCRVDRLLRFRLLRLARMILYEYARFIFRKPFRLVVNLGYSRVSS